METPTFGENLKTIRKMMGITQLQLGERAGLGQVAIANYENGKRFPGEKNLRILSESLSVSLDVLLGMKENTPSEKGGIQGSVDELMSLILKDSTNSAWFYIKRWSEGCGFNLQQIYTHIITPLLEQTGHLWVRGKISVAQEHLISGSVRELIIRSSTEAGTAASKIRKRLWMGLCAPGEEHELGLLMNSALVKELGWQVFNLGTQVPFSDLLSMILELKPDILCFSVTMERNVNGLRQSLDTLQQLRTPDLKIVICGASAQNIQSGEYDKVVLRTCSLEEAASCCHDFEKEYIHG